MNQKNVESQNILEQISQICRDFRKQISQGKPARIEKYLSGISEDGRETLFSNLLEIEINFRQRKGDHPTTDEYLKRFPQFAKQVRRAFFEPTMASVDSDGSVDEATRPLKDATSESTLTFQIPNANRMGDYELVREVGRGGMGVVYEARHSKSGNRVALKTLPTGGRDQEVNADKLYRFRREFRRLSEVNHPNLVGMQTLEVDGSQWFFTMDLIDGDDFLNFVRPNDELDETRLRSCLAQLAKGVMALHRHGIIHRDLKPSNVLVSGDGRVSILDFGLAAEMQKTTDMTQTKSGIFAGTPRYAAPEQMFGERTEASDWYALGTMLYESLTGEPPFTSKNQIELLRQKQNDQAPQLSDQSQLAEDLAQLANGLIQRDPNKRLTAQDVAQRLELDLKTRTGGSISGSHGSSGSVPDEEFDLENLEDDEIILVGRDQELAKLDFIKADFLANRKPQITWVTGLSGEGKSSLVEKFLQPIRQGDEMLVLSGRCYDRESVPFKVIDSFIDPLVRFLRSLTEEEVKQLLPPDATALTQLFPMLRRLKGISDQDTRQLARLDDKQIHSLAFVALKELLRNISQRIPIVIFVDDIQWGDADSAAIISNQLGSEDSPAVWLLGSYRRDEADDSPFLTIWDKANNDQPDRIVHSLVEVHPLTPKQAVELISLRAGLSTEKIERQAGELIADTHGNPYFLEQLIEGFDAATGTFRAVPLNEIIATKLKRLPADATPLLEAISVAGKSVSLLEVSHVCGLNQSTLGTVAHMRSERLVRLIGSGEQQTVDTYHDKIRETLLASLSEQRKVTLHVAFGEWIEQQFAHCTTRPTIVNSGTDSSEADANMHPRSADLAYHFVNSGETERAFRYSLAAGRQAMAAFAFSDALGFLEQSRSLEPETVNADDQFRMRFLLGKALSGVGRLDDCVQELQNAATLADKSLDRFEAYFALAESRYRQGDYRAADQGYRRSFAELGERLPKTIIGKLFRILSSLFTIHLMPRGLLRLLTRKDEKKTIQTVQMYPRFSQLMSHLDMFGFLDAAVRSCSLSKSQNCLEHECVTFGYYAVLLRLSGIPIIANVVMRRALQLNDKLESTATLGASKYNEGVVDYLKGKLQDAEQKLVESDNLLTKVDDYHRIFTVHFLRHTWSIRGHASKIEEFAKKEHKVSSDSNEEITMAYGDYGLADALSRQGDFEQAIFLGARAVSVLEKWNGVFKSIAYQELGRAQLQASDYSAARKTLSHAVHLVSRLRFFEVSVSSFPLLVEAVLGAHWATEPKLIPRPDLNKARRTSFIGRLTGWIFPNNLPHAIRVSGRAACARRKSRKAMKYFDKAIAAAMKIGADYEHARALIDKSMLDYPEAQSDREKGLELLESLGCVLPDAEVEYLAFDRSEHHA